MPSLRWLQKKTIPHLESINLLADFVNGLEVCLFGMFGVRKQASILITMFKYHSLFKEHSSVGSSF